MLLSAPLRKGRTIPQALTPGRRREIVAHVQADYLFGRPVTGRPASLVARLDPIPFQPAAFSDWTFGDSANTAEALGFGKTLAHNLTLRGKQPVTVICSNYVATQQN